MIFQFAGLISAACVTYIYAPTPVDYASVRDAYLGFSIVGFILSLVIFILYTLNVLTVGAARKVPWALIVRISYFNFSFLFLSLKILDSNIRHHLVDTNVYFINCMCS